MYTIIIIEFLMHWNPVSMLRLGSQKWYSDISGVALYVTSGRGGFGAKIPRLGTLG